MTCFISSMLRLLGNGRRSVACAVACLFSEIILAMPMRQNSSAIALSDLDAGRNEMTKGDVASTNNKYQTNFANILVTLILVLVTSVANATIINNTANVNHTLGTATASVNVDANIRTTSSIELFQYAPGVSGASNIPVMPSEYSNSGTSSGPFAPSTPATDLSGGAIPTPASHDLVPISAIKSGEPIFVRITDGDQNNDPAVAESIVIQLSTSLSGDSVVLRLTETGPNTGVFTGYVQTTSGAVVSNDEFLSVNINDTITVSYTDATDSSDSATASVLVDPYGVLFSTSDGTPLDGARVTLVDASTGQPAQVFGDDGISSFPATVISGGTTTDSNGNTYNFPAGGYRFPFVQPGNYQLYVIPPTGFVAPSSVPTASIQALPGAPYAIVNGSRGENFTVNPGPALHIDIPLDPTNSGLFVTKSAGKDSAAIGEFVQYKLNVSNVAAGGLTGTTMTDVLPPGFRLEKGSVRANGAIAADPTISSDGRTLQFNIGDLPASTSVDISYVAAIGIGTPVGDAINTASATANGGIVSNMALAKVRVEDDMMSTRSFIMGRVIMGSCKADPAEKGFVSIQLQSKAAMDEVHYTAILNVEQVPVQKLEVSVDLPEVLEYIPGSALLNGHAAADPKISASHLQFELGDQAAGQKPILFFTTRSRSEVYGEFTTQANARFYVNEHTAKPDATLIFTPVVSNRFKDYPRSYRTRFDTLSAELSSNDKDNLADLAHMLRDQRVSKVTIVGHADKRKIRASSQSRFKNNEELSLARATAVATYIKQLFKLTDQQLVTTGLGISRPIYYSEKLQGTLLSKEDQLSLNRRVEVYIELEDQLADTRFIVSQGDSEIKQVTTLGPEGAMSGPDLGLDDPGVKGIRLYLEDGRFVDTDEQGLYHFEGIRPGTHVVQIDEDSLPDNLEIYQCEDNTRFAGTPHSRFVDVQAGGLWRADFHIRKKSKLASHGQVSLQISSELDGERIHYQARVTGTSIQFRNRTLLVKLPDGIRYANNSVKLDNELLNAPGIENGYLAFYLGDKKETSWNSILTFEADAKLRTEGEYKTTAMLRFTTTDGTTQYSSLGTNSILYQAKIKERQIFEAGYNGKEADLSEADRADLDSVIDFLLDKRVRKIRVVGHTDNQPVPAHLATLYSDNKALSLDRATKIGSYLARKLGLYSKQVEVIGRGADEPRSPNDTEEGRQANRRTEVYVSYGDNSGQRETIISDRDSGILSSIINSNSQPNDTAKTQQPGNQAADHKPVDGILSITQGQRINDRIQAIRIRMDSRLIPILSVDGVEVSKKRIGLKAPEESSGRTIYSYIGVDLGEKSGEHTISLRGMGPFGNTRFQQDITYIRTGEILSARILSSDGNIADGKTPVRIQVQLLDQSGEPINADAEFTFVDGSLKPYEDRDKLRELRESRKTVLIDREGYIKFDPVTQSGLYNAVLSYNNFTFEVRTYVTPKYRDWIMVGLAEGTAGFNNISGNMENLDAADIEDEYYSDGRLAFYAKGKVKGKYLLTTAYDSEKEKPEVTGNGLFGSIDPNKYYTLYGDKTQVYYDAASSEKLYLKLESDQFYTLFGDYETDLTVTELSRYSRSLTGLKTEYKSNHVDLVAFAAETEFGFVKDELRGDGTSGLYHLSNKNIVINSEKIRIEVRDRFRSEVVIDSKQLTRYIDYTFDPVDGTVYFREPIYSRDENFNPIYIVVDYEAEGNVGNQITAGGRLAVRPSVKGPEIGATIIKDDTVGAEGELYGADVKYKLTQSTNIRAELATSSRTASGKDQDGNAGLVEIIHQSASVDSNVYFRQQDPEFGLGQQKGSESGTRKYGAEVRTKIKDNLSLEAEYIHQDNLNTDAKRDVLDTSVEVKSKIYTVNGGVKFARDEFSDGTVQESNLLTGSAKREFVDGRLDGYVSGEVGIDNNNIDYPDRLLFGADYGLTESTQLFAQQEFSFSDNQDAQMTRAGIKTAPWRNANIYSSVENQSSEYGPRLFANMGLTQGFELTKNWRMDFGLERSETIRNPDTPPFNVNVPPASGSPNNDFTAVSIGAAYKNALWSMTGRADVRLGDLEDKLALLFGLYHEPKPGFGLASALKHFDTDRSNGTRNTQTSLEFSLARRPISSQWIILDKIRFSHEKELGGNDDVTTVKFINNINTNYLYNRSNQVAFNHGIKYIKDNFDSDSYSGITQIFSTEYRHDFNRKWDAGVQASILVSDVGDSERYSYGVSIGHSFAKNVWLSAGFNFAGFTDQDFSGAKYTAEGFYVKFRFAFDHYTARKAMAWWEK
ncbi:OmpA family protein [Kaarinaea lacus]